MTNKTIVVSSLTILGLGVTHALINRKPLSRVIQGGLVVMTVLSLLDALDPNRLGAMASAMASLAALTVVMAEVPPILRSMRFI